jgi:hypothetical protein
MGPVHVIRCNYVVAQVSLGYYDQEGNLVGEETFPRGENGPAVAKLFHPLGVQFASLIDTCVDQAWEKLRAAEQAEEPQRHEEHQGNSKEGATARR